MGFKTRSISSIGFLTSVNASKLKGAITQSILSLSIGSIVSEVISALFSGTTQGFINHLCLNLSKDNQSLSPQLPSCISLSPVSWPLICINSAENACATSRPCGVLNQVSNARYFFAWSSRNKIMFSSGHHYTLVPHSYISHQATCINIGQRSKK